MAIENILDKILKEPLIKNMRQLIVDGIEQVYEDATLGGDTEMEILRARGSSPTLDKRLDETDSEITKKRDVSVQITQNDVDDNFKQQMAGNTPINAVPAKGSLTTERFKPKSLNENAVSFIKTGKNLFNKNAALSGYYLNSTTGELQTAYGEGRFVSDFIKINATKKYFANVFLRSWGFFDNNYNFISGGTTSTLGTIPNNAVFVLYCADLTSIEICQIEEGITSTLYEPYKLILEKNDYTKKIEELNKFHYGLGRSVANFGKVRKNVGDFTGHRSYNIAFKGWAYEFKKSEFSENITRVEAFVNIGTNVDKEITLVFLKDDRLTEIYKTTELFSEQGKIVFNVNVPIDLLSNTFYIAYKTDSSFGIMPSNAVINSDYLTSGTYYFEKGIWSLAITPYNTTDLKVYTGFSSSIGHHTHKADDIEGFHISENKVTLSLPEKYELVVGDTFELFYKGIVYAIDPNRYNIKIESTKGNAYRRKYEYTPTNNDIGTHLLKLSVLSDDDVVLDSKEVNLIIKNKSSNPSSVVNVLHVGDSLMAKGEYVTEVRRRLVAEDGLTNINFIGTCGVGEDRYEGYGGWRFAEYNTQGRGTAEVWIDVNLGMKDNTDQHSIYQDSNGVNWKLETIDLENNQLKIIRQNGTTDLPSIGSLTWISGGMNTTNISYSINRIATQNPFWDNASGKVDFANYINKLGVTSLDHVVVLLGWNESISTELAYKNEARKFISNIKLSFPNAKITLIGLQVPDIDGIGVNYGATWNYKDKLKFVFDLNKWLIDLTKEYSNVDFINLAGQFDTEFNMPSSEISVNRRNSSIKEKRGYNGVHPALSGYYQIADAEYRNLHHKI